MQVSIIVPLVASNRFLAQTLASVLRQSFDDFEVLLVSRTDPTVVAPAIDDSRIRVVTSRAHTESDLINEGLDLAAGEVVKVLMPGDLLDPFCLELQVEALRYHAQVSVIASRAKLIDTHNRVIRRQGSDAERGSPAPSSLLARRDVASLLVREGGLQAGDLPDGLFARLPLALVHQRVDVSAKVVAHSVSA